MGVGTCVGDGVGGRIGGEVGKGVGAFVGVAVGAVVGWRVGWGEGDGVGAFVQLFPHRHAHVFPPSSVLFHSPQSQPGSFRSSSHFALPLQSQKPERHIPSGRLQLVSIPSFNEPVLVQLFVLR